MLYLVFSSQQILNNEQCRGRILCKMAHETPHKTPQTGDVLSSSSAGHTYNTWRGRPGPTGSTLRDPGRHRHPLNARIRTDKPFYIFDQLHSSWLSLAHAAHTAHGSDIVLATMYCDIACDYFRPAAPAVYCMYGQSKQNRCPFLAFVAHLPKPQFSLDALRAVNQF